MSAASDAAPERTIHRTDLLPPRGSVDRRERAEGIARSFGAVKAQHAARRTLGEVAADRLTHVASSPTFLIVHLLWFATWLAVNAGIGRSAPFDPFPFGLLTLILSIEAIVLTIFVLMSQGRDATVAELREEITLQVNLRMEAEVTKTLQLVTGLYARLGLTIGDDAELREMLRPLDAHEIEQELVHEMDGRDERGARPDGSRAAGGTTEGTPEG